MLQILKLLFGNALQGGFSPKSLMKRSVMSLSKRKRQRLRLLDKVGDRRVVRWRKRQRLGLLNWGGVGANDDEDEEGRESRVFVWI